MIEQRAYLRDCMDAMAEFPDKFFDLAVVDPPYGIGEDGAKNATRGGAAKPRPYAVKTWDKEAPSQLYFDELRRVSKNQIVWGANHFISRIPIDSPCWLFWDKDNYGDFADGELAWCSFKTAVRKFKYRWAGMLQQNMKEKEERFHPTQKPIALYDWIFANYAKPGQKILDTHLGSGSSRIAANKAGMDFWGYELDADYFAAHEKRYANFIAQLRLF